ncbi:MAG: glucose-6-phosphate isomerase, partial [Alphaproteobacteria bacterium]|nr:glucose-6-phosphate isomerase [Alphaproteobacteria bacterium]
MPYSQTIDRCFGATGLERDAVSALQRALPAGIARLGAARLDGTLPLLGLPERQDDLIRLTEIARDFRERFDDVVVLGIGGSSLGARTLVGLAQRGFGPARGAPRLHFMDNVDPVTFADLEAATDPTRTGLIVISKSGSTAEPLLQFFVLLPRLRAALGSKLAAAVVAITEATDNPLR